MYCNEWIDAFGAGEQQTDWHEWVFLTINYLRIELVFAIVEPKII